METRFEWQHIQFIDGSNSYICKTDNEFKRIQKKYNLINLGGRFWLAE